MREPVALQEGGAGVQLAALIGDASAVDRERFRLRTSALSHRLQRELALRELPFRIEDRATGSELLARGIAGTVRLGAHEIDIRPKHVQSTDEDWRACLVTMLERSSPRRTSFVRTRRLQLRHRTFVDQFAHGFALELEAATQHADVRIYRSRQEELPHLRGRLLVAQQVRASLMRPHRLICEVDALDPDNPTNRLLHWVGQRLQQLVTDVQVRRFLSVQLDRLPSVSSPLTLPTPLVAVLPRQYAHYAGAVQLALAFARGRTTFPGVSDVGGAGFVVGTERLFESFLERTLIAVALRKSPGSWRVRPQESELFATPEAGGRNYYSRPDNVVDRDGAPVLIADAKYKRFHDSTEHVRRDRPSNADLYQMAAASVAHACPRALLVYPRMQVGDDQSPTWAIRWWRVKGIGKDPIHIGAVTVDLSGLNSPEAIGHFDTQMSALIDAAAVEAPNVEPHLNDTARQRR